MKKLLFLILSAVLFGNVFANNSSSQSISSGSWGSHYSMANGGYELLYDSNIIYTDSNTPLYADRQTLSLVSGSNQYIKDKWQVFFRNERIGGANPKNFEIIDEENNYAKDNKQVYYQSLVVYDADVATFQSLGGGYARDQNALYIQADRVPLSQISDTSEKTLSLLQSGGIIYFDKNTIIEGSAKDGYYITSDPLPPFHIAHIDRYVGDHEYAIDSDHVYYKKSIDHGGEGNDNSYLQHIWTIMSGADPLSFAEITLSGSYYARPMDAKYVYAQGEILMKNDSTLHTAAYLQGLLRNNDKVFCGGDNSLDGLPIDMSTFEVVSDGFMRDKNNIYAGCYPIPGVDKKTWKPLTDWYSKDKSMVYGGITPMSGVDIASVRFVTGGVDNLRRLRDKNNIYGRIGYSPVPLPSTIDLPTLQWLHDGCIVDANKIYYMSYKTTGEENQYQVPDHRLTSSIPRIGFELVEDSNGHFFQDARGRRYSSCNPRDRILPQTSQTPQSEKNTKTQLPGNYARGKKFYYFGDKKIPGAFASQPYTLLDYNTSFAGIGNNVYYDGQLVTGAVVEGFQGIGNDCFKDIRNTYCYNYLKSIFSIVSGVDSSTFERLDATYAKDKDAVYAGMKKIEGSDPNSFIIIDPKDTSNRLAKDKHHVYYDGIVLSGIDSQTATYFDGYIKDNDHVYCDFHPLTGADIGSFTGVEGTNLFRDSNALYDRNCNKLPMDVATFTGFGPNNMYWKDKYGVYGGYFEKIEAFDMRATTVSGAQYPLDPDTVEVIVDREPYKRGVGILKDKNGVYDINNVKIKPFGKDGTTPLVVMTGGLQTGKLVDLIVMYLLTMSFQTDGESIYDRYGNEFTNIKDPKSFVFLQNEANQGVPMFAKDRYMLYALGTEINPLNQIDVDSYRTLSKDVIINNNGVYVAKRPKDASKKRIFKKLSGADPKTFVHIGSVYWKDKNSVYVNKEQGGLKKLVGANPNTFVQLSSPFERYAQDGNTFYYLGKKLEGQALEDFHNNNN